MEYLQTSISSSSFSTMEKEGRNKRAACDHAEAETRRREKLNRRFRSLQSLLPSASKSDSSEAVVLSNAVSYIDELQTKMEDLESQLDNVKKPNSEDEATSGERKSGVEVEVKIMGLDRAVVRVQTKNMSYAVARLMEALRDLELKVHHATMCNIKDLTLQDLVIGLPPELVTTEEGIKASLLGILNNNS